MDSSPPSAPGWHLAQINVARLVAPEGDPCVQPFFDALDRINALADEAPGFVWRLQTEAGNATELQVTPDPQLIINISVWSDAEALSAFVYRSGHSAELARRVDYFEPFGTTFLALWWVRTGHRPTIDEGLSRLWMIDRFGPTAAAFTMRARFPAPQ